MGNILVELGKIKEAFRYFKKGVAIDAQNISNIQNLEIRNFVYSEMKQINGFELRREVAKY